MKPCGPPDRFNDRECEQRKSCNHHAPDHVCRARGHGGVFRDLQFRGCWHAAGRRPDGHDHHGRVGDPARVPRDALGPRAQGAEETALAPRESGGFDGGNTMPGRSDLRDNFVGRMRAALGWFSNLPTLRRRSILMKGFLAAVVAFLFCLVLVWGTEKAIGNSLSCGLWGECPYGATPGIHPMGYGGNGRGLLALGRRNGRDRKAKPRRPRAAEPVRWRPARRRKPWRRRVPRPRCVTRSRRLARARRIPDPAAVDQAPRGGQPGRPSLAPRQANESRPIHRLTGSRSVADDRHRNPTKRHQSLTFTMVYEVAAGYWAAG